MSEEQSRQRIREIQNGTVDKATLAGIVINNVNFTYLNKYALSKANFKNSKMVNVGFHNISMADTQFTGSELEDVEWDNIMLFGTHFTKCRITNCSFTNVHLTQSDFTDAILSNTVFSAKSYREVRFRGAQFRNITFEEMPEKSYRILRALLSKDQIAECFVYTKEGERVAFLDYRPKEDSPPKNETKKERTPDREPEPNPIPKSVLDTPWTPGARSTTPGCPSDGLLPVRDCKRKKQQSLVFHPDKNPACRETSSGKMQVLNNYCP
jgi:Pentapeptide repeats (9 copies)